MRKLKFILAVALLAVSPTPSHAQVFNGGFSGIYTGGTDFATTASVALNYSWDSQTSIAIFGLNVTNMGIYDEVYKAIGLINIPPALIGNVGPAEAYPYPSNDPQDWGPNTSNDLNGIDDAEWAWVSTSPFPKAGLQVGESAQFFFKITGIQLVEVQGVGAGVHGGASDIVPGCSTKMGVLPDGSGGGTVVREGPYSCTSVVPEPTTVVLLATGLFGLGAVAHRRRRGSLEIEEEDEA